VTLEALGALLVRALGVVMFLLGLQALLGPVIWSLFLSSRQHQDTYFVVGPSIVWVGVLFLSGVVFLVFSKPLGRLLAKGLP
jgi:hypothetical protein